MPFIEKFTDKFDVFNMPRSVRAYDPYSDPTLSSEKISPVDGFQNTSPTTVSRVFPPQPSVRSAQPFQIPKLRAVETFD